jgi:hypothetical protein
MTESTHGGCGQPSGQRDGINIELTFTGIDNLARASSIIVKQINNILYVLNGAFVEYQYVINIKTMAGHRETS